MPQQKDQTGLVFPALPEEIYHPWLQRLSKNDQAALLKARSEMVITDAKTLAKRIRELPGFESVPEEAVLHLAQRWAITLANTYSEGQQKGTELEHDLTEPQRWRDHHYRLNAQEAIAG